MKLHKITSTLRLLLIICHKSVLLISTFRQVDCVYAQVLWISMFWQVDFVQFMDFVDFDI